MPADRASDIAWAVRAEMVRSEPSNVPSRSVATSSIVTCVDDARTHFGLREADRFLDRSASVVELDESTNRGFAVDGGRNHRGYVVTGDRFSGRAVFRGGDRSGPAPKYESIR